MRKIGTQYGHKVLSSFNCQSFRYRAQPGSMSFMASLSSLCLAVLIPSHKPLRTKSPSVIILFYHFWSYLKHPSNILPSPLCVQASNQTDLENWVTAIHSASASLFAKRHGKEDTVRLLRSQIRGLLQKVDMDGKMKKMAELQLSIVSDPKNRKAIENQVRMR